MATGNVSPENLGLESIIKEAKDWERLCVPVEKAWAAWLKSIIRDAIVWRRKK